MIKIKISWIKSETDNKNFKIPENLGFNVIAVSYTHLDVYKRQTPDSTFFTKLETSTKFNGNEALNSFIAKILKGVIYITAAFIILADMNINLGGLVAGLGIGSAALALAAQDFVKSLIGGFAIISDKTFEIGDFIEIGLYSGTVIDITFRSTKVRAVNNEIISIPNSVIVTEYVKNGSKIENRRIETRLRIGLDTRCV